MVVRTLRLTREVILTALPELAPYARAATIIHPERAAPG